MKYPIGIQNFESLRRSGFFYVDKTDMIYRLAASGRYFFLSRPRRFGKSLLISTLEAYFRGQRELFRGLAIDRLEREWTEYPVLHLDLNSRDYVDAEALKAELSKHLELWEDIYGNSYRDKAPEERFYHIIRMAYEQTGRPVAILVDEYDKPLLQNIGDEERLDKMRSSLKAFYSVLKTQDRYIRFALLTGVTKFSKVSVFSDLNNLNDISMDAEYTALCGITEDEIRRDLDDEVGGMAAANQMTKEECYGELRLRYDGYHFRENSVGVYNPFSLLNALSKKDFKDYWFQTGTPTFLAELLKSSGYNLDNLTQEQVTSDLLNSIDSVRQDPIPVLYQSGYLTIKGYDRRFRTYRLGYPNLEVEGGFINFLVPYYLPRHQEGKTSFGIERFVGDVENGRPEAFMNRLCAFFADGNYQIAGSMELYFQNAMYVVFKMLGFYVQTERTTSNGRIDIVMQTSSYIYLMELKLDGSADEALAQIREKGYDRPFCADSRRLFRIGVNFSSQTRRIEDWKVE